MAETIEATFDGEVFRPTRSISLPPNTTVRLTVEPVEDKPNSFLHIARALNLEGPPDWAKNLDTYLYGEKAGGGGEH